jgi:uncharacterized protein
MSENGTANTSGERPRWLRAALVGGVIGVLAVGVAVALTLDGGAQPTPAAADPTTVAPSTSAPTSTSTSEPSSAPTPSVPVAVRTITVTGQGTATVKPDMATVQLGVSVQRPTADGALQQANQSATALIDALKGAGVADDDISTSNLSIWPQYDNTRIVGYTASNNVTVKVRDIDKTGPVIDAAAGAAGNDVTVGGISFGLADPEQTLAAARADAMANAAKRASEFAAAANTGVGPVLQISETTVTPFMPVPYAGAAPTATTVAAGTVPTPIQTGTTDVSVTVNVVYALS